MPDMSLICLLQFHGMLQFHDKTKAFRNKKRLVTMYFFAHFLQLKPWQFSMVLHKQNNLKRLDSPLKHPNIIMNTLQKMKFSIKDFFSKCDQIHNSLRIQSQLLKKSLMENFIFCTVAVRKKLNTQNRGIFKTISNI